MGFTSELTIFSCFVCVVNVRAHESTTNNEKLKGLIALAKINVSFKTLDKFPFKQSTSWQKEQSYSFTDYGYMQLHGNPG